VEKISLALAEFQDEEDFESKAGLFLSALINNCPESEFVIHTRHLGVKIFYLGLYNTKDITIKGDVGDYLAYSMSGGRITVEGNAGYGAGNTMENGEIIIDGNSDYFLGDRMKGGKITVKGNAGNEAGSNMGNGEIVIDGDGGIYMGVKMKNGKITVKGNSGSYTGAEMENGEIIVNGDELHLAGNIRGGKIYHKGKLVFPKGDENAG
jgi:formylmethanofuran dehydrogenase subunit C